MQLINIIGAFVIGAILVLMVHQAQGTVVETNYQISLDCQAQRGAALIFEILHQDLRRTGHLVDPPRSAILLARPDEISFRGDVDLDGVVETVRYWISDPSACPDSPNPADRILYREVDGAPSIDSPLGVTDFELAYFDEDGQPTTNTEEIVSISLRIEVQSLLPYPAQGEYGICVMETQITPKAIARINW